MAENSSIEWTDHTFNPWLGCTKVAPGCTHCYAETLMDTRWGKVEWGPNGTRVKTSDSNWREPLKWNRAAEKAGERARVFCASLADVFEDWGGPVLDSKGNELDGPSVDSHSAMYAEGLTLADLRRELFALIDATPWLDWLLLTKRPENVRRMWRMGPKFCACRSGEQGCAHCTGYRRNVWLLTSVSEQASADKNVPELLKCRDLAPVIGLSCEPLLGPINLRWASNHDNGVKSLDWIIVGGESGHGARSCNVEHVRSIVDQCAAASVPVFVKQLGANITVRNDSASEWPNDADGWIYDADQYGWNHQGDDVQISLRDRKGGDISEWPEDLRVRDFPSVATTTGATA